MIIYEFIINLLICFYGYNLQYLIRAFEANTKLLLEAIFVMSRQLVA